MIKILQLLNQDKDRCVLIGRMAFNLLLNLNPSSSLLTKDMDVVCPDLSTADECAKLLLDNGFRKNTGFFSHPDLSELDVLISDPESPETVMGGYYNLHSLRMLWESRERRDGYLIPCVDALVADKLLHARGNEGKDLEAISVYFRLRPQYLPYFVKNALPKRTLEERDAMLHSLHAGLSDDETAKSLIENVMLRALEEDDSSHSKPR